MNISHLVTLCVAALFLAACSASAVKTSKHTTDTNTSSATKPATDPASKWSSSCQIHQTCAPKTMASCDANTSQNAIIGTVTSTTSLTELGCQQYSCCNSSSTEYLLKATNGEQWILTGHLALKCKGDESTVCCDTTIKSGATIVVTGTKTLNIGKSTAGPIHQLTVSTLCAKSP